MTHIEAISWIAGGGNYIAVREGERLNAGMILSATHPSGRAATPEEIQGLTRFCFAVWDMPE